ncbi:MAG: glycerol-3-phosphate acyltransferase [SAR202 cluster bacterium]|jgi:glycerol-3-phosphate acyltransferase PlsY|nr:MAG: glycerol-3-phosphate acyltransferase [SAR202 cluster bacterium]MCH2530066.1 glycerol-3-phosphate acyltransferase [Dehalococcoidia bacterium]KAA1299969.1 MAG: glycerol-3-phosphate acyltransferase [SAR202 cluster bacterium]KAA1302898.1 MAG: glycerol-3-phosphate acyltransferase [SAR202 cluster bacterium]MDP6960656.1 glycerol-3-phosphate acyltransferase [Dehalococcoidia bacterium]|tara:strand:- start:379 stop:954 length:576 start_codon:yes stop_codon:yes gene_type:complete
MDTSSHVIVMLVVGYLLGSIPFARLFTMRSGIDLFEVGTGNPGAANVFRKIDKRIGAAVFLADGLKGALPVFIANMMGAPQDLWIIAGAAAVIGHWYPIFNRFKGGAGLATGAGVVLGLMPLAGITGIVAGILMIAWVKSSAHGALTGLIVILLLAIPFGYQWPAMVASSMLAAVLFAKAVTRGWKPGRKD